MNHNRFEAPPAHAETVFTRDTATWGSYFMLSLLTLAYNLIGPVMPSLRGALGLSFAQGAYHTVAMAIGLCLVGLNGDKIVRRFGRRATIKISLSGMAAGALLLCSAFNLAMSLGGVLLIGSASALTLVTAPTIMAERHGLRVGIAYGEANVIAYLGIFIVPAAVSVAIATVGWRWSFVPLFIAYSLFWSVFRRTDFGEPAPRPAGSARRSPGFAFWCFWALLVVSVSAELNLLVWGASYLENVKQLPRDVALLASMVFPAGMMLGRALGALLLRRMPARLMIYPTLGLALAGFLVFSTGGSGLQALSGLFITGLGMANLYPLGITMAVTSAQGATDAATARISLASGTAMVSAPFIVGTLADSYDLGAAFGVIPVYLAIAAGVSLLGMNAVTHR